jgi:opacity protein-like surface antigen
MQIHRKIAFLIILLSTSWCAYTQVVFEPTYHTVYPYLSRLAQKGVIDLDDVVLPLSKDYIYSKLDELSSKMTELTPLEREELAFYLKEYTLWWRQDPKSGFEGEYKSVFQTKIGDRFRLAAYQDKGFAVNIQPIVGYESSSSGKFSTSNFNKGFWAYGYIGKHIGFSVDFRDHVLTGDLDSTDYKREFSPETGRIGIRWDKNTFKYNEVNAQITAQWKWGYASFGKTYLPIGYGTAGKIFISEKAPSSPNFKLVLHPVNWLQFSYTHAWLNSDIVDSTSIYPTTISGKNQYNYRAKYLAAHTLTMKPMKGLSVMIGESVIYNNSNYSPTYLVPLMMFIGTDHYLGGNRNNSTSNTQLYFQVSSRNHIKKTHLYFSYFIDEIRLSGVAGDSSNTRNQTAYQLGMSVADFPIKNVSMTLEYAKIRPFAYENYVPAQTYANGGYNLGYWTGTNSDQLYMDILWRIKRGWNFKFIYQYVRKGDKGTGYQQQYERATPFLFGDVRKFEEWGLETNYEIIHDLFVRLSYRARKNSSDTILKNNYSRNTFTLGFNYGF